MFSVDATFCLIVLVFERFSYTQLTIVVWAGTIETLETGPFVIHKKLITNTYLNLLCYSVLPALNEVVSEWWIGKRGHVDWSARVPDSLTFTSSMAT